MNKQSASGHNEYPTVAAPQLVRQSPASSNLCVASLDSRPLQLYDLGSDDLTGLTLAQYRLGKRIGMGGMGQVFQATHQHLGKQFAIKFVRSEVITREVYERFEREIQAVGKLQHANVISAIDSGLHNNLLYFVTELLQGRDLADWLQARGPMTFEAAAEVIRQACLGLEHVHRCGLIHRDIKPSNLFLDQQGQVKLFDFGISRSFEAADSPLTCDQFLGSIDFASPEQARDVREVTAASDLYSLGATWIHLMTGRTYFSEQRELSLINKLQELTSGSFDFLSRFQLPDDQASILRQLLASQPKERIQSAAAVADLLQPLADPSALQQWLGGYSLCLPSDRWTANRSQPIDSGAVITNGPAVWKWSAAAIVALFVLWIATGRDSRRSPVDHHTGVEITERLEQPLSERHADSGKPQVLDAPVRAVKLDTVNSLRSAHLEDELKRVQP